MKCCVCKRNIASGADAQKMILEYQQPDGSTRLLGPLMPDGPITAATGQLRRAFHGKCFYAVTKRADKESRAARALATITADRSADPGHTEPSERDWRDQSRIDIPHDMTGRANAQR